MSENFEQVPGQEQVRHACRITPHPKVKDAVQVFVEGLEFPVTNIFDARANLLERGFIAEDPRMQQDADFWFLTRVSDKTYIIKNENSPRNGQPAYYIDVVKVWPVSYTHLDVYKRQQGPPHLSQWRPASDQYIRIGHQPGRFYKGQEG